MGWSEWKNLGSDPVKIATVCGYATGLDDYQKTFTLTFNSGDNTRLFIDATIYVNSGLTSATVSINGETKSMDIYNAQWQFSTQQFFIDCDKNTDYNIDFVANFSSKNSARGYANIFA